jgi:hypothetical protein
MLSTPLRALARLNRLIAKQMPALIAPHRPAAAAGPAIDKRDRLDRGRKLYARGGNVNHKWLRCNQNPIKTFRFGLARP